MNSLEPTSFVSITDVPEDAGFSTFFWHIFKKRRCTDVEFGLKDPDGPTFSAHKMVLSLWSPYFEDKFYEKGKLKDVAINIIQINDINLEAFGTMLRFMYGNIPLLETPRQACELYKVAARYEVNGVMKLCDQFLRRLEIVPTNVFGMLEVSGCMHNKTLGVKCLELIQERTGEVMTSYKLSEISPFMIHTFLGLPELSLESEYQLLLWVFDWATEMSSKDRSTRQVLEEILPNMQFLSLDNREFAALYSEHEAFFSKDEALSIFMNIALPGKWQMPAWYDKNRPPRVYTGSRD